jgi:hypothetical protein
MHQLRYLHLILIPSLLLMSHQYRSSWACQLSLIVTCAKSAAIPAKVVVVQVQVEIELMTTIWSAQAMQWLYWCVIELIC